MYSHRRKKKHLLLHPKTRFSTKAKKKKTFIRSVEEKMCFLITGEILHISTQWRPYSLFISNKDKHSCRGEKKMFERKAGLDFRRSHEEGNNINLWKYLQYERKRLVSLIVRQSSTIYWSSTPIYITLVYHNSPFMLLVYLVEHRWTITDLREKL